MQEALKKLSSNSVETVDKTVTLCIRSQRFRLSGIWNWEMQSPAVYCSDVMSFPDEFTGTKGIIHPDDLQKLTGALSLMEEKEVPRLDFCIITTYGEVKTISGQRVSIEAGRNERVEPVPGKEPWEKALQQLALQKENDFLKLRNELTEYTERLHGIGSWLINRQTGETWYSDNVFRMYGLAPQSLNTHANTFNHFIHKDDRFAVLDAFEKAYEKQAPLHIEYRIVLTEGETRYIQQITKWFYAVNGQQIFSGIVRDVTAERSVLDELQAAQSHTFLHQQLLKFSEHNTATGYWYMNLATRKTDYSENYYRIYGLKQAMLPAYNSFLNLVHADDRARVRELIEKMYNEHTLPETEFRIVRPDGKQRYLKQTAKLFISPNKELFMIGLVQDISAQKGLEKKILELNENISLTKALTDLAEEKSGTASFVWLPDGYMQWSDGFYKMLGYKPGGLEPLPRFLYKNIHHDDLKVFRDAESLLLCHQSHDDIVVRLISRNGVRNVRISFQQINYGREATIAFVHDITKQTELNEQFAANKLFSGLLEESVNDMIIFTNVDHTILHWNKLAEEKTGIAKEEALYNNLFDVLPRLNDEDFLGKLHLASRGTEGHVSRAINVYLKKSHDYWLWPLKNEAGEVLGVLHVVQDISKQLELQQQLSERLNFIENLIESSVDRIVVLDRFMNYLYWNKKAEEYYVINKERVLGKNILEVFPSFRNNLNYQQFQTVLRGETVYLPPNPKEDDEYSETYLIPVKNDSGDVSAILWLVHDLSQQYKAEQEMRQKQELLQATMDSTLDMIQVFEAIRSEEGEIIDFRYVLLNHEAEKWMPNAVGKSLSQLQLGVVEEGIFDAFVQVVETGIPQQYEKHYVHEQFDGWFYQSVVKMDDGVVTTTTDITARKKAEEEVLRLKDEMAKKAEDKYRILFESIDEGVAIMELILDEEGRTIDWLYLEHNPSLARLTGLSQNIVGKKASDIYKNLEPFWMETFVRVVRDGIPERFEYGVAELGNRWFDVYAARVGGSDSRKIVLVYNNVTERKRHEERQTYLLKLTDALRSLSDALSIQDTVTREAMAYFNSDRCYYCEIENDAAIVRRDASRDNLPSIVGVYPLSDFALFTAAIDAEKPFTVDDIHTTELVDEPLKQICIGLQLISFIIIPVIKDEKPVGLFCLVQSNSRQWQETEIQLAVETAERTWAAVERAKAEEALRKAEEKYRSQLESEVMQRTSELEKSKELMQSVFDASLHAIILFKAVRDGKGDIQDYEILLENSVVREWNRRSLLGKLYAEEFPHIKQHGIFEAYNRVLQTGEPMKMDVKYEGEGLSNWFTITAIKVNDDELVASSEDITEQKNAEEELKKNLTLLQHNEQLAQTGSWEYEIQTGKFTWSEGMYNLFGLPQHINIRPEIYLDFAVEEDRTVANRIVSNLKKKHRGFEESMRIKKVNEERLLMIKASVVYDEKGKPQKIIGVDIDITNIRNAEKNLKESRHWLEQTAKASPDSIAIYDLQKKQPLYLNNCLAEWVGLSNKELIEMGIDGRLQLIHPDDRLKLLQHNERIAEANDGEVMTIEYRIEVSGKIIWLRNRSKPFLRSASGKVTHILSILQNITDEAELSEQLKQRTEFAEAILDASVDRITVFDCNYKFVGWNKRCEQIHRKSKEEVMGKTIFEIFPGVENYPEFMESQERSIKGEFVHVPVVKDAFTGDDLELFYIPLKNEKGETYAVVNVMHDISDFVLSSQALNLVNKKLESKNIELEQKNEEITSFAFVASHDMKEPLRKIHTFSDWLMEQEINQLSPRGKSLIEKINASVHRMEILIDDILVLTKIHSDTHREEEVDLNAIVKQVMDDMSEQILQTRTIIETKKMPAIKGNSNQLFYLFKNLINNAIKFQKPGSVPQLTITSEIVNGSEISLDKTEEEYLKLSFMDNGFGFDQRYAKKIFQVFQRLHGKHEFEGTGIGLAICKKIMENHNGTITVQSEQGKGSVFTCFFPLH